MEERYIMEKVVEKINNDSEGVCRFLLSNPHTTFPYYTFDGMITPDLFWKRLYYESMEVDVCKRNIFRFLYDDNGKNTAFILGYQGCGKTTFINSLLYHYYNEVCVDKSNIALIDCDKFGVSSEEEPVGIIYAKNILRHLKNNENSLENFISFFIDNASVLEFECTAYKCIHSFYQFAKDYLAHKHLTNPDDSNEMHMYLQQCNIKCLIYLLAFLTMSSRYNDSANAEPIFLLTDNLDCIENLHELQKFIKGIDDFTIDMSQSFHHFKLFKHSDVRFNFVDKIKIIIAMRETTRAQLPNTHFSDTFRTLYKSFDITEWYNKSDIVNKRIEFIASDSELSLEKKCNLNLICEIMRDRNYMQGVYAPLFKALRPMG